jgi:hypothetical protein
VLAHVICVEDLNLRGMAKNHSLARSLHDASIGAAIRMIEERAGYCRVLWGREKGAVVKTMRKSQLILRCFAQQDPDGSWFAMCLDLNLYARAGSLPEVKEQLREIMAEYIREAATEDREYADDLLGRRTPVRFWLRYYWYKFLIFIFGRGHRGGNDQKPAGHLPYKSPLPMVPAC